MINTNKDCCGCSACVQRCPRECISLRGDKEGFLYPVINENTCIDCGLCEKVCPIVNINEPRHPIKVYAAKHNNEEMRMKSSSGGIFSLLAEQIIDEGGVVFGARFDEHWEVIHDYTETKEGLTAFRGSKYVQSRLGLTFQQAESFLKKGRKVMFVGTPCQIAGLKLFLGKNYGNLQTVDIVCHGVPSPLIWRIYLDEINKNIANQSSIKDISFRDKLKGWKKFSLSFTFAMNDEEGLESSNYISNIHHENPYMRAFLSNLNLRPSCYNCKLRSGRSMSDVTIGDFWNVQKLNSNYDDDLGVSLIMSYGLELNMLDNYIEADYKDAIQGNYCINNSVACPYASRFRFFEVLKRKKNIAETVNVVLSKNLIYYFFRLFDKILYKLKNK